MARSRQGILVSQRKYALDLLSETGMSGCRPIDTPMDPNTKLKSRNEETAVEKGQYQRLVGKLIYLIYTTSDISFVVSIVSQFLSNPSEYDIEAVYHILRHIKRIQERECCSRSLLTIMTLKSIQLQIGLDHSLTENLPQAITRMCRET